MIAIHEPHPLSTISPTEGYDSYWDLDVAASESTSLNSAEPVDAYLAFAEHADD